MSIIMTGSKEELVNTCKCFIENTFFEETKQNNLLVEQAKTYISEHLADELSVTSIAEQLFVTVSYFSRLFKAETGSGCNEYIVRKRMEKARVLLETTNIRIGGIASMVGYRDMNYFSLAFKKFAGCSPKEYRERCKQ